MLFLSSSDIPGTTEDGRCICLIFRSAAYGGFGADEGSWLIEVGAGEKIFNKLIENYYRMMGVFR